MIVLVPAKLPAAGNGPLSENVPASVPSAVKFVRNAVRPVVKVLDPAVPEPLTEPVTVRPGPMVVVKESKNDVLSVPTGLGITFVAVSVSVPV